MVKEWKPSVMPEQQREHSTTLKMEEYNGLFEFQLPQEMMGRERELVIELAKLLTDGHISEDAALQQLDNNFPIRCGPRQTYAIGVRRQPGEIFAKAYNDPVGSEAYQKLKAKVNELLQKYSTPDPSQ